MSALTLEKRIRLMTVKQLAARMEEVERYLRDISPRASRFSTLHHELRLLRIRYRELDDPNLGL